VVHHHEDRRTGQSLPNSLYSVVLLDLRIDGVTATGTWSERTSPAGYYKGTSYHGALQRVTIRCSGECRPSGPDSTCATE
jgi:hypothetical protein